MLLKPIVPQTQEEQLEHSLAAERRRVRMLHDDIIRDLLTHGCIQQGNRPLLDNQTSLAYNNHVIVTGDSVEFGNAVAAERTKVESVELVLPPHTNHQVSPACPFISKSNIVIDYQTLHYSPIFWGECKQVHTFGGQIMAWMVNVATIAAR